MGKFGIDTRRWLLGVIRQRKLLIKTNRSRKPQPEAEQSVKKLEDLLSCYSYENDSHMARFFMEHVSDIITVLPGKGSTGFEKKALEFESIRKQALLIGIPVKVGDIFAYERT